jgi:hypothetical protein
VQQQIANGARDALPHAGQLFQPGDRAGQISPVVP